MAVNRASYGEIDVRFNTKICDHDTEENSALKESERLSSYAQGGKYRQIFTDSEQ